MANGEGTTETDAQIEAATRGFRLTRTVLRIRNPEVSIAFYSRVLGFHVIHKYDLPELKYSIYVLAHDQRPPESPGERAAWLFGRRGLLELRHNWENDTGGRSDEGGALQPFGHMAIHVPDVHAACARFQRLGVPLIKRPQDGVIHGIALIKDPDGYVIEIVSPHSLAEAIKG